MMIPRDIINRRKKIYLTLVAVGFSAMAILAVAEEYMPSVLFKTLLYSAISLFLIGNILMYIGIWCPKCKAILGYIIVFSAGKADQCPHCRINFDESILK
jgi:CHASE2 domain-containing sensor protein